MAAYISFQPSDFFNTLLWTGDGSASRSLTGVGFQPDFTWIKPRSTTIEHNLYDSPRGATWALQSNNDEAQGQNNGYGWLSAFDADGFTVVEGGSNASRVNDNTVTYVGWNWKMGTTSGLSGGTITPSSYSISTTGGQSVIAYTGTGSAGTIPHGLGVTPQMIILKETSNATDWAVYHIKVGNAKFLKLNTDAAQAATSNWNSTSPTTSLFSVGSGDQSNTSGRTYVAYCFASIKGYSKFGGYTGNGNADGPFVYTGFRPAYIMLKCITGGSSNWAIFDPKREGYNVDNDALYADTTAVEATSDDIDILSNGFKLRNTGFTLNTSADTYIYAAFAEFPLVSSNSKAGTAR